MDYRTLINRPKTKRGRETLNRIVSAAAQAFYEKGYYGASINDIVRLADVSTGTFYIYFDGKYNLYKFLMLQCSHSIRKHLHQATQNCKTRREVEEVGLRAWLQYSLENPYTYYIIWESIYIDKHLFVDYYSTFSKAYSRGIDAAKADGDVRSDVDTEVMAYILMGATNFLGLNWCALRNRANEIDHVIESFMRFLDSGMFSIATPKAVPVNDSPLAISIRVDFEDEPVDDSPEDTCLESFEDCIDEDSATGSHGTKTSPV